MIATGSDRQPRAGDEVDDAVRVANQRIVLAGHYQHRHTDAGEVRRR